MKYHLLPLRVSEGTLWHYKMLLKVCVKTHYCIAPLLWGVGASHQLRSTVHFVAGLRLSLICCQP
jgi:hypothetical protein